MKTLIILLAMVAVGSARGQLGPDGQEFSTSVPNLADQALELKPAPAVKPNEIRGARANISYSGIGPELVKTDNPLQLINPWAPPEYGYGEQNLSQNITIRHEPGLKVFAINF
jgi:hypothetical protein